MDTAKFSSFLLASLGVYHTTSTVQQYKKAMKLDAKFAPGDTSKPFSDAIKQTFATGNVLPLVSGAFAEVNVEAQHLVEKCAKHAAVLEDNSDITPGEVSSAKGSAYNLLLSQF